MSEVSEICIYSAISAGAVLRSLAATTRSTGLDTVGGAGVIIGIIAAGVHTLQGAAEFGALYALSGPVAEADTAKMVMNLVIPLTLRLYGAPLVLSPWIYLSSAALFCIAAARIRCSRCWGGGGSPRPASTQAR